MIEFSLLRCKEYVVKHTHHDVDQENQHVWEHQWDQFLTDFYLVCHDNAKIQVVIELKKICCDLFLIKSSFIAELVYCIINFISLVQNLVTCIFNCQNFRSSVCGMQSYVGQYSKDSNGIHCRWGHEHLDNQTGIIFERTW